MQSADLTYWGHVHWQGHVIWLRPQHFAWWYDLTADRPDADPALALVRHGPFPDQDIAIETAKREIEEASHLAAWSVTHP